MTNISFLWHIHQPPAWDAGEKYLKEAVEKSYNIIFDYVLPRLPENAKININITGITLELLNKDYSSIIKKMKKYISKGMIEITGTAYYHPILALIPPEEAENQIRMNQKICKKLLNYTPKGFFPPEMGWSSYLISLLNKVGFEWVIIDESLFKKSDPMLKDEWLYKPFWIEGPDNKIKCVPRCKPISQGFWAASVGGYSVNDFMGYINNYDKKNYLVSSTDAELLGLHWFQGPSYFIELIKKIMDSDNNLTFISDYMEKIVPETSMFLEAGTWAHDGDYTLWNAHPDDITQDLMCREARNKIETAQYFIKMCENLGAKSRKSKENLKKAWRFLYLADMSDSRGWDPAPVRIKYGYHNALKAKEYAEKSISQIIKELKK